MIIFHSQQRDLSKYRLFSRKCSEVREWWRRIDRVSSFFNKFTSHIFVVTHLCYLKYATIAEHCVADSLYKSMPSLEMIAKSSSGMI
jgi:hypothetical protein